MVIVALEYATVHYHIAKSLAGGKFGELTLLNIWRKKVWINRSAKKLLIVSTNLDGFSLMNHGWFAKLPHPTKFSRYMVSKNQMVEIL